MSEEKGKSAKETIAEEAKGLAVEVYRDGAKGAVQEAGHVVGAIAKLLLWPVRKIVDGANNAIDRLSSRVEKKLEGVPPDRLLPAPATIAGPSALHYAMLGEGDEVADLREMFENLLMSSMDRDTTSNAHPAFVTVISQMTPEDAWITKSINRRDYAAFDVIEHHAQGKRGHGLYMQRVRGSWAGTEGSAERARWREIHASAMGGLWAQPCERMAADAGARSGARAREQRARWRAPRAPGFKRLVSAIKYAIKTAIAGPVHEPGSALSRTSQFLCVA